ncbi:beta-1,3-galactosyltransferase brn [Hylaeus anthracinus]|uniref:beta-1,3-galactosyltransferase brn n=1 Tax=Hylaeus anthracinus TaxID=313031 RepID=UPI0023B8D4A7|nr:beta-1,3-galactosyltransferase brn [Hylaeus anthracinus]XP_054015168.1 beta-1,3-galactosyltransferase brn [Hylaeus anthracinus]
MYCLLRPCFQRSFRLVTKLKLKYVCVFISLVILLDFFGAFTHFLEVTYDSNFVYPYEGDIHEFVNALRHNEKPAVDPINEYNYTFILNNKEKCVDAAYSSYRVVYIVKSAIENFERRSAIRKSWGFEKRFFDVPSKTIFMLGVHPYDDEVQTKLEKEAAKYKDIIQASSADSYYNNTIKTMMSFKWLVKYCSNSKFYMFVDDDMYVSVKNVLRFIRNPANYPDYLKEHKKFGAHKREIGDSNEINELDNKNLSMQRSTDILNEKDSFIYKTLNTFNTDIIHKFKEDLSNETSNTVPVLKTDTFIETYTNYSKKIQSNETETVKTEFTLKRRKRQIFDFELPDDVRLFAGFVFVSSPHRHKSSKWYVPLSEYPYHLWPPYVTAGAYILSKEALLDLYYASFYTKHFRFDDVYLGLVAKKADIEPFHCEEFHFYKKDYTKFNYKYVISSHGYGNPNELLNVWNEQKALGNA